MSRLEFICKTKPNQLNSNELRSSKKKKNRDNSKNKLPSSPPPTSPKPKKDQLSISRSRTIVQELSQAGKQPSTNLLQNELKENMELQLNFQRKMSCFWLKILEWKKKKGVILMIQKKINQSHRVKSSKCGGSIFVNRLEIHVLSTT